MKTKITTITLLGIVFYSCSPKVAAPVVATPEVALTAELAEGKGLFENNCAKCHKLYSPSDYTKVQWTPILAEMQIKAHLDDAQREKIYNYLTMN